MAVNTQYGMTNSLLQGLMNMILDSKYMIMIPSQKMISYVKLTSFNIIRWRLICNCTCSQ